MSLRASITNISRGSLHDGKGIRTVVYFAGCGLRCAWCHNPETFDAVKKILYAPVKCIHCGRCIEICPEHHLTDGNNMLYLREGCGVCGRCAEACPAQALTVCGNDMSVEEVMEEAEKDRHYYKASGGGITLSGGECLLHSEFCEALLKSCCERNIHTALETALFVPREALKRVIPYTGSFFADLKIADPAKHRAYTGQDNECIIDNLRYLSKSAPKGSITVRIPMIPGVNDDAAELCALSGIISSLDAGVDSVELLRYNPLAESKYLQVGMGYRSFGDSPQSNSEMERMAEILRAGLKGKFSVHYR